MLNKKISGSMLALALFSSFSCQAEDWSKLEVQYKRGTLDTPEFAGGGDESTEVWFETPQQLFVGIEYQYW